MALVVAGCGKPPEAETQAAQAAMNDAKAAEAATYAGAELDAAEDTLAAAQAEVEKQNSKFALFRNYKEAGRMMAVAQGLAQNAQQVAGVEKEKARVEAEGLYTQLSAAVDSTRALMEKAPRDKEGKKIMAMIMTDLDGAAATMPEIRAMIDKGDYRGAIQNARASMQKVESLRSEIQGAIDKKASMRSGT
jgi:hypothetical protein